jgi:cell division protein FtsL
MSHHRPFLALWVLAICAGVAAFVLHLAMRGRSMSLGYELGRTRAEQARLREVRRVLELEVASYQTPQRVEVVARTLLAMAPPHPSRIISLSANLSSAAAEPTLTPIASASAARAPGAPASSLTTPQRPVITPPAPQRPTVLPPGAPPAAEVQ